MNVTNAGAMGSALCAAERRTAAFLFASSSPRLRYAFTVYTSCKIGICMSIDPQLDWHNGPRSGSCNALTVRHVRWHV
jgi:hypothetical protein